MMIPRHNDAPLSRMVEVKDIPPGGLDMTVSASEVERAALAAFNGLPSVQSLAAPLTLRHESGGGVHVTGEVTARVVQTCVVSLDPFEATLREPVDVHYLPPDALEAFRAARAADRANDDEPPPDEPDAIEHGRIDLGALVAEHLTLGLDPYPRKPGAELDPRAHPDEQEDSPFAVLRTLRDPQA